MSVELERDLRTYLSYLDTVLPTISADNIVEPEAALAPVPPPRRRGWVVAVAAAVMVLVLVGGVDWLLRVGPARAPVVTEPPRTTTTLASDLEGLRGFALSDVPPFRATASVETTAGDMVVSIEYEGIDGGFRWEVIEATSNEFSVGTYHMWDGRFDAAQFSPRNRTMYRPLTQPMGHEMMGLGQLTWATGEWPERCGLDEFNLLAAEYTLLDQETIADRGAIHVRCTRIGDEWEVWLDAATGIVLRGTEFPLFGPGNEEEFVGNQEWEEGVEVHSFEFLTLDYSPVPADRFAIVTPQGWSDPNGEEWAAIAETLPERIPAEQELPGAGFMHPLVGSPAPPLTGELLSGQPFTLDDLSGKPAVVFFGGSECPPCVEHLPLLQRAIDEFGERISFITVLHPEYEHDPQNAAALIQTEGYTFPAVQPDDLSEYGPAESSVILGVPTTMLIDADGNIAAVFYGIRNYEAYEAIFERAGF